MSHLSHTEKNMEYCVVVTDSPECKALRGVGSGDTLVANPNHWRQDAVVGCFTIFVRQLSK